MSDTISGKKRSDSERVVITGVGLCSPIGDSLDEVSAALRGQRHGIAVMGDWDEVGQLGTRLAAPVTTVSRKDFHRKKTRTMGRVGVLSLFATERAVQDAGLDPALLSSGRVGLAHGSTHGSSGALEQFATSLFSNYSFAGLQGSAYLKIMSHTTAANLAMHYSIRGRVLTTCAACVSASQAIGLAYEAVRSGQQDVMLAGGAEELHFTHAGIFDIMFATSTKYNDQPALSPRPFDAHRDGLVVGEGAATVVLESYARAKARRARIYGEIVGFGTNCDGMHVTRPSTEGMAGAMRLALDDAGLRGRDMDYINAHGTATQLGDIAESKAAMAVYGGDIPISSTKSYTAHTLGACGGIEAIFCLAMLRDDFVPPTRNLSEVDPNCAPLAYVTGDVEEQRSNLIANNNFAFGGMNTSLIFARV